MSISFTPSRDLMLGSKIPPVPSLFTTFTSGHFIKPGQFTQPVKATSPADQKPATFAGCFTEVFTAPAIDLDFDEPNAVSEAELELVQPSGSVHRMVLPVFRGLAINQEPRVA
jgi:hypothetical protein